MKCISLLLLFSTMHMNVWLIVFDFNVLYKNDRKSLKIDDKKNYFRPKQKIVMVTVTDTYLFISLKPTTFCYLSKIKSYFAPSYLFLCSGPTISFTNNITKIFFLFVLALLMWKRVFHMRILVFKTYICTCNIFFLPLCEKEMCETRNRKKVKIK